MSSKQQQLDLLRNETLGDCQRCKLHQTRDNIVFGEGSAEAKIFFIGEGPGKDENSSGRPFVGRAGQLLTGIIEKGMQIPRSEVYIANIVKCRPTLNMEGKRDRPPDEEEVGACTPFLMKQIEIISPKVIVTLGNPSTQFLLKTKIGITKMHGNWQLFKGIPVMPMFHPSYVLRNGGEKSPLKREVWEDVKKILAYLDSGELPQNLQDSKKAPLEVHARPTKNKGQGKLF